MRDLITVQHAAKKDKKINFALFHELGKILLTIVKNIMCQVLISPLRNNCFLQNSVPFIPYMPNKPEKFYIKFWLLVDVCLKHLCNGKPYLG